VSGEEGLRVITRGELDRQGAVFQSRDVSHVQNLFKKNKEWSEEKKKKSSQITVLQKKKER